MPGECENSTAEIEITPEMIDAGCDALRLCEPYDALSSVAKLVYRAMEKARLELLPNRLGQI